MKQSGEGQRNCFVIGPARSGTKFLRDAISAHPDVSKVPYDINFVWRQGNEHLEHDELEARHLTKELRDRIVSDVERFRRGSSVLVEKTVSNCLRVEFVFDIFPDARFLLLRRDPIDVIESVYRQWWARASTAYLVNKGLFFWRFMLGRYGLDYLRAFFLRPLSGQGKVWGVRYRGIEKDLREKELLEVCAIQWRRCSEAMERDAKKLPSSQVLCVGYEELVGSPSRVLERLLGFLGRRFPDELEREIPPVELGNIGKGYRNLSDSQLETIRRCLS